MRMISGDGTRLLGGAQRRVRRGGRLFWMLFRSRRVRVVQTDLGGLVGLVRGVRMCLGKGVDVSRSFMIGRGL